MFSLVEAELWDIVVVGAGGGGIIAAWRAASLGAKVLLSERNDRIGVKIRISGGGRCNITHAGAMEEIRSAFPVREGRFLKPAFHRFGNEEIIRLLEEEGVKTAPRPNGRVFPLSGDARDVVGAFARRLTSAGVELRLGWRIDAVSPRAEGDFLLVGPEGELRTRSVILATGGVSYPKTGTTGDGVRWARELGHTIVPLRAALAPIVVAPPLPREWRGIALRDGRLTARQGRKLIASWEGDLLVTHDGVSGPAVLEIARAVALAMESGDVELAYDSLPASSFEETDLLLTRALQERRGMTISTLLDQWLPNRMVEGLLLSAGVAPGTRGYVLTREERRRVVGILKECRIGRVASIPIERGEVSAGGVALDEVDPQTMRSRKVPGIYLCGELLDIAGPIGGYNLQAAFSTGYVAGESAARSLLPHTAPPPRV